MAPPPSDGTASERTQSGRRRDGRRHADTDATDATDATEADIDDGTQAPADDQRARRIQAALDDFYDTLARLPVVGVARWSELGRLEDLIARHPEAAGRMIEDLPPR